MSELPQKSKFRVMEYASIAVLIEYHSCDTLCEVDECHSCTFSEAKENVADFYRDEVQYYKNKLFLSEQAVKYWSTVSLEEWEKNGPSINDYE